MWFVHITFKSLIDKFVEVKWEASIFFIYCLSDNYLSCVSTLLNVTEFSYSFEMVTENVMLITA